MTFGPNSNNPRERRSYAHAMLAKARATGALAEYQAAYQAAGAAGTSRKSQRANFGSQLLNLAMKDRATHTLAEKGDYLLRSEFTLSPNNLDDDPDHFVTIFRNLEHSDSTDMHVAATFDCSNNPAELTPSELFVVDWDKTRSETYDDATYNVPVRDARVDAAAARLLPDGIRERLAALVERAAILRQ